MIQNHYRFIWRLLFGLGVRSAAIDQAAAQVFSVAADQLRRIARGEERAFLVRTALGVAGRTARMHKARQHNFLEDQGTDPADPRFAGAGGVSDREAVSLLRDVLDVLPTETRLVFVLFELEGLALEEIGALLSRAPGELASVFEEGRAAFLAKARVVRARLGLPGSGS